MVSWTSDWYIYINGRVPSGILRNWMNHQGIGEVLASGTSNMARNPKKNRGEIGEHIYVYILYIYICKYRYIVYIYIYLYI